MKGIAVPLICWPYIVKSYSCIQSKHLRQIPIPAITCKSQGWMNVTPSYPSSFLVNIACHQVLKGTFLTVASNSKILLSLVLGMVSGTNTVQGDPNYKTRELIIIPYYPCYCSKLNWSNLRPNLHKRLCF